MPVPYSSLARGLVSHGRRRWPLALAVALALWSLGAVTPRGSHAAVHHGRAPRAAQSALAEAAQTVAALAAADTSPRDLYDLARRLQLHQTTPIDPYVGRGVPDYPVGRVDSFYVACYDTGYFSMTARLVAKTPHAYWYVAQSATPDAATPASCLPTVPRAPSFPKNLQAATAAVARSAQVFETRTYPIDHANFGMEWTPGIDHDPRLTILYGPEPGVGGYYTAEDLYPRLIAPYSNQRKMLYVSTLSGDPGTTSFDSTLAHEFQHMIHRNMHPRDDAWVNEGASMLAEYLNGYGADGFEQDFVQMPDTQLDTWHEDPAGLNIAHYGASFLWLLYFYQHYGGQKALRLLLADASRTGMPLFDDALRKLGSADTITAMFRKWTVANYLDKPSLGDGSYGYRGVQVQAAITRTLSTFPASVAGRLPQYATNYVALKVAPGATAPLTITFHGAPTVPLIGAAAPPSGWLWWSNRGDLMNTNLTHAFDLRHIKQATLRYALWYDTEKDFDYGYVEVSADGGATWYTQHTAHTTNSDPNGANYGNAYTGRSDAAAGAPRDGWLQESVDLSRYAGKKILVRFEYVTDDAMNLQGLALDSVRVPEIGFAQDASSPSGWDSNGWVRVHNVLPETWLVQAIVQGQDGIHVVPVPVQGGTGSLSLPTAGVSRVVLVISPLAPQTTLPGAYTLDVNRGG